MSSAISPAKVFRFDVGFHVPVITGVLGAVVGGKAPRYLLATNGMVEGSLMLRIIIKT